MTGHRAVSPADVLPDGRDHATFGGAAVRKGSVAAFVANARALPSLAPGSAEHRRTLDALRELVPALRAVGVFEVFGPRSPELARELGLE